MSAEVVRLRGVAKTYPGRVSALTDVDLSIERGEGVAVVGPSGSGKSTLLHIMGTLDRPSAGEVRIDGHDVAALSDRRLSAVRARRIGFVFQRFHLAPGVPAVHNVADGLLYAGIGRHERIQRAEAALERVGLRHRSRHLPQQLSGGEQQRVAIARAIAGEPALLLADEPTGSLDTESGREVLTILRELRATGTTVVVVTHDEDIAQRLPRRIQVRDGRVA